MTIVAPRITVSQRVPGPGFVSDGFSSVRVLVDKLRLRNVNAGDTGEVVGVHTTVPTGSWTLNGGAAKKNDEIAVTPGSGISRPGQNFTIAGDATVYRVCSYTPGSIRRCQELDRDLVGCRPSQRRRHHRAGRLGAGRYFGASLSSIWSPRAMCRAPTPTSSSS